MKKTIFILTILLLISNISLIFAESTYDIHKIFSNLEDLAIYLRDQGYLVNAPEIDEVPDIRIITGTGREELKEKGYIYGEGYSVEKRNDGKYDLFLDTKNKPKRMGLKPIESEYKDFHLGCVRIEKLNNFDDVRKFVDNTIGNEKVLSFYSNADNLFETDLNLLRENLEKQKVPEDEIQYVLSVYTDKYISPNIEIDLRNLQEGTLGSHIDYHLQGYRIYKDENYYTVCYLAGGSKDNPDYIINRDNPQEFFNILEDIKNRIDYQFNLGDRDGKHWLRDLNVGTGRIWINFSDHPHSEIGYFQRMQDNIIIQPEWMKGQVLEAFKMYDTLTVSAQYHEISPEILKNPNAIHYIPPTTERYIISITDAIIPPSPEEEPEKEPEEKPEKEPEEKPEKEPEEKPEKEPDPDPIPKIIITIVIIILAIIVVLKIPFIPFIPLFYYSRKVPIYSNLKQEDGTIIRKKIFSERYEVNGTQLIVDITDTMSMYKEYNYLEIEIPQDIAYSVATKVKEDKKIKEIIPRTLIITHKNHNEPIQATVISKDLYNEEKNIFIIKLNV